MSITISFPERKLFTGCSNKKGRTVFLIERIARELPQRRRRTGVSVSTNGGPVPSAGTHDFELDYRTSSRCAPAVLAKMSIAVVLSSLSFGEKQLAKYAYVTLTTRLGRSVVIKVAHIFEGSGLAMVGGAGGLYDIVDMSGRTDGRGGRGRCLVLSARIYLRPDGPKADAEGRSLPPCAAMNMATADRQ